MTKGIFHYRCHGPDGELLSRGGVTIAWECDGDKVIYGMALCDPRDGYIKRKGRQKAEGYLKSKQPILEKRRGWLSGQGWDIIEHRDKRRELLRWATELWYDNLVPKTDGSFLGLLDITEWLRLQPWRWYIA